MKWKVILKTKIYLNILSETFQLPRFASSSTGKRLTNIYIFRKSIITSKPFPKYLVLPFCEQNNDFKCTTDQKCTKRPTRCELIKIPKVRTDHKSTKLKSTKLYRYEQTRKHIAYINSRKYWYMGRKIRKLLYKLFILY